MAGDRQHRLLTVAEEGELLTRARAGDQVARDRLVIHNERLVWAEVRRQMKWAGSMEAEDLFIEGITGLLRAIDLFDPERGGRLTTYAVPWIRQAIGRATQEQSRLIRLPAGVWDSVRQVGREMGQGGDVTAAAVGAAIGLPPGAVEAPLSIDAPLGEGGGTAAEVIPTEGDFTKVLLDRLELAPLLKRLPNERFRRVIVWRYGLGGGGAWTLAEIAAEMGLSRERVRQMEMQALGLLREMMEGRGPLPAADPKPKPKPAAPQSPPAERKRTKRGPYVRKVYAAECDEVPEGWLPMEGGGQLVLAEIGDG